MLITVTEEQKRVIESQGYMVIQYKKWCYDTLPMLEKFTHRIYDTILNFYEKLIFFIQDMARKIRVALEPVIYALNEVIDEFKQCDESLFDERPRYEFVRSLWRDYEVCKGNKVIYHRCRDRC